MAKLELTTDASIPTDTSVSITVYEDATDDGVADNQATQTIDDGENSYILSGFDGSSGNDVWTDVDVSTSDKTSTPLLNSIAIVEAEVDLKLTTEATIPTDTSISVTVYEDSDGDGTVNNSDTISIDGGTNTYEFYGFDGSSGNDVWLDVNPSTTDNTTTPSLNSAFLRGNRVIDAGSITQATTSTLSSNETAIIDEAGSITAAQATTTVSAFPPFELVVDGDSHDAERGLTSGTISTGGKVTKDGPVADETAYANEAGGVSGSTASPLVANIIETADDTGSIQAAVASVQSASEFALADDANYSISLGPNDDVEMSGYDGQTHTFAFRVKRNKNMDTSWTEIAINGTGSTADDGTGGRLPGVWFNDPKDPNDDPSIHWRFSTATNGNEGIDAGSVEQGSWRSFVGVVDLSVPEMRVYNEDGLLASTTLSDSTPGSGTSTFNLRRGDNGRVEYELTDVVFDNSAWSKSKALEYTSGGDPTSPLGFWPTNTGSGSTLYDVAGGNDGTITGGVWAARTTSALVTPRATSDHGTAAESGSVESAATTPLTTSDLALADDTGHVNGAVSTPLTTAEYAAAIEAGSVEPATASPLIGDGFGSSTIGGATTSSTATPISAGEFGLADDGGAIEAAFSKPLSSPTFGSATDYGTAAFTLTDDATANDANIGLTSDAISGGGQLAPDDRPRATATPTVAELIKRAADSGSLSQAVASSLTTRGYAISRESGAVTSATATTTAATDVGIADDTAATQTATAAPKTGVLVATIQDDGTVQTARATTLAALGITLTGVVRTVPDATIETTTDGIIVTTPT